MSSGSRPIILLLPGGWHKPSIYSKVITLLNEAGYSACSVALHSVGADPADTNFDNDVTAVRKILVELVESEQKDVVLVSHSYSGMLASEAPRGLEKRARQAKGLNGGVIRLIYVSALVFPEDFDPAASGAGFPDWMKIDQQRGITTVTPEDAKRIFYHDVESAEEQDRLAAELDILSIGVFTSKQTYAGWKHIPSTFVRCGLDRSSLSTEMQDMMIAGARQAEPTAFDVVERVDAGHCVMVSKPGWFAEMCRRAAGEKL